MREITVTREVLARIAAIGQSLRDTQFESRYDEVLEEFGTELIALTGACEICYGEQSDPDDPCPSCGGRWPTKQH